MKVMLTDKEMGVEDEDDERLRWGEKAGENHSSLSLDMSLSKALNPSTARVNQQQDKWVLLGGSPGGKLCVAA